MRQVGQYFIGWGCNWRQQFLFGLMWHMVDIRDPWPLRTMWGFCIGPFYLKAYEPRDLIGPTRTPRG